MSDWINSEHELPLPHQVVLGCDKYSGFVTLCRLVPDPKEDDLYLFETMYIDRFEGDSEITHWMQLPEIPHE